MRILVTGSIAYDVLLSYDGSFKDAIDPADLDHLSVSFFSPHYARHHGGTGANIAWNLKLLHQHSLLVGTVGQDGGAYTALLEERGIETKHVEVLRDHVTATAIIGTDSAERQIAFFHPGADAEGRWPDLADERDDLAYAIIGARNPTLMLEAVRFCRESLVPYLFDPGQQIIGLSKDDLRTSVKGSTGVIANAYEWTLLSEKIGMSVEDILGETSYLIVTHGEDGLTIYESKRGKEGQEGKVGVRTTVIPACKTDRLVNPTGAGDALRAGLLTGLVAGWTLEESGMLGAALASFVVEQEGTLLDDVDVEEVRERARITYNKELPKLS